MPEGLILYKNPEPVMARLFGQQSMHCWQANVHVKCAGGVRTLDDLLKMKAAGATRSGATATEAMIEEARKRFGNMQ